MRTELIIAMAALGCTLLASCKGGYNRPYRPPADEPISEVAPSCTTAPATTLLSDQTRSAYNYIQRLSCNHSDLETGEDGVIAGQAVYIGEDERLRELGSYENVITKANANGGAPGILAVSYQTGYGVGLQEVNNTVGDFWQQHGAMVMVTWRPGHPAAPDSGPNHRADLDLDLAQLVGGSGSAAENFIAQLNQVGEALRQLRENNITVLFDPLPSANTDDYWWGTGNSYVASTGTTTPTSTYLELYREARQYLIDQYVLNNVLWLYSPAETPTGDATDKDGAPPKWTYPGDTRVDIVSPIVRNDYLLFDDYEAIVGWNKPLGFSAFGPADVRRGGQFSEDEPFDFDTFSDTLREQFNAAGFLVTPYNNYFDPDPDDGDDPVIGNYSFYDFEDWDGFDGSGLFSSQDLVDNNWRGTGN